ncbi:tetratricopeptide repeat protein [Nocardia sp. alder85J]|uniref:tetratricopeptide repeat protein n=1 Tax=Nocardia sp. alder85J TaxID=2862949 RepID=UPI0022587BC1|nr:tetratricopeptide repeat protein [Nocardia sp. alder85J]MCX4094631.1 tetratricopeptide repeat protein [Nocardia sp. alder85J]
MNPVRELHKSPTAYAVEPLPLVAPPLTGEQARDQPARLLLSRHRVVPFAGRGAEQADIAEWLDSGVGTVSARLWHAPAGHGKTRLAEHVAAQCARAGWTVGQALQTQAAGPRPINEFLSSTAESARRALLVVDYADRWAFSRLYALLLEMYRAALWSGATVRAMLLARSAGFWWHALAERLDEELRMDTAARFLPPLAPAPDPVPTNGPLLSDGERLGRAALFDDAAAAFAAAMDSTGPPPQAPAALDDPDFESVLTIHMAALVAVDAELRGARAPAQPHALSGYLLRREQQQWVRLHTRSEDPRPTPPRTMARTAYTATLTGALSRAHARTALTRVRLATTTSRADHLIDDHRYHYPPEHDTTALQPLHPDRLGEDMIALSTPGHSHHDTWTPDPWTTTAPASLLIGPTESDPTLPWTPTTLTVLIETAHRWPHISTATQTLLRAQPHLAIAAGGSALTRLTELPDLDPATLEAVDPLLPDSWHVDFDIATAAVDSALLPYHLAAATGPAEQAAVLSRRSRRLERAGRHREALAAAEQAVELERALAATDPVTHEAALAESLHNLAIRLAGAGRSEESLGPAEDAVARWRRPAATGPAARQRKLAVALNNLGNRLAELGRPDDAVGAGTEAVSWYRRLAAADPAHELELATATMNLGNWLAAANRRDEALAAVEQTVAVYRRMASADPGAYNSYLAESLNNLALILSDLGRTEQGLIVAEESVELLRRQAAGSPGFFERELATALSNLAISLSAAERHEDALRAMREATALYRRSTEADPASYPGDLPFALMNLADLLSNSGRHEEGLPHAVAAVRSYRRLTAVDPAYNTPYFAAALGILGKLSSSMNRYEEALGPLAEAVTHRRRLAETSPAAYEPALARSLWRYATALYRADRLTDAHTIAREAVDRFRRLHTAQPELFTADLAGARTTLTDIRDALGRSGDAEPGTTDTPTAGPAPS